MMFFGNGRPELVHLMLDEFLHTLQFVLALLGY